MKSQVIKLLTIILVMLARTNSQSIPPNIVFIMLDDVGWADFNYNVNGKSTIPTPNIDRLAGQGIKLNRHYAHPSCTPSRAALMTGRYAIDTGLTFSMLPSCPFGLPEDISTMPELLRKAGYNTHMVGNWHLGYSQWKQTPVGRGFESYTGSLAWDLDSYDKSIWKTPWDMLGLDWIEAHENGTYRHQIDNTHVTHLITQKVLSKMDYHTKDDPFFMYVSFPAAHSPLQPDPESASKCQHIPHLWRRQFCGMVVGLDTAIGQIYESAQEKLGSNTVIVVSSDNGGSVWFGGLNEPLRSGKLSAFEGGVRVPAFAVDMSGKYLGKGGREFKHKMHISDWLPTFLSWADAKNISNDQNFDGIDHSGAFISGKEARTEILLEVYSQEDSHDDKSMVAYIKGKYKLIEGDIRDPYYYMEPTKDIVNSTDPLWYPRRLFEMTTRILDYLFGPTKAEGFRILMSNVLLFENYGARIGPQTYLFDLEEDPEEKNNLADRHPDIVKDILDAAQKIKEKSRPPIKYYMVDYKNGKTTVPGQCEGSVVPSHLCRFVHPWIGDDVDLNSMDLQHGVDAMKKEVLMDLAFGMLLIVLVILCVCFLVFCVVNKRSKKKVE